VIILPKTVPPKTVSKRLDLSFGIFARRDEKYSCYADGVVVPFDGSEEAKGYQPTIHLK